MITFNGISFYAKNLGNNVHCTFISIFFYVGVSKKLFGLVGFYGICNAKSSLYIYNK